MIKRANWGACYPPQGGIHLGLTVLLLAVSGCGALRPKRDPGKVSKYSQLAGVPPSAPPKGKTLVFFHRPAEALTHLYFTAVWDDEHWIADLGYIQSVAYVCDPGRHVFSSRGPSRVSVVEADLLADQVYDIWISEWKIRPITVGSEQRALVSDWMNRAVWISRGPMAGEYEQRAVEEVGRVIHDFTVGDKKGRLLHLNPEDHR